jgi:hypothetical protein
MKGPVHGLLGGPANAPAVDFCCRGLAHGPGDGQVLDLGNQDAAPPSGKFLAVGQTSRLQGQKSAGWKHDRRRKDRAKHAPAAYLVHPGAIGRIMALPWVHPAG